MANPLHYHAFVGLAETAVVVQRKLAVDVPAWMAWTEVMLPVDLERFAPRAPDPALAKRWGVREGERVIVYPGGLNHFLRPGLEALCRAVGLINRDGVPCRLLRSGPVPIDFLDRLPPEAADAVTELGVLPREDIPRLVALADVLVQPGKQDAFEDLRLSGKLPEFLASGKPVVMPDTNIAFLLRDGVDAVLHRTGSAEEMARKCLELFADPGRAAAIGAQGRRFAERHFDPRIQARILEGVYRNACESFDGEVAARTWSADAATIPVPALLARRLHLLAARAKPEAPMNPTMLQGFARGIEREFDRASGLDAALTARIAEVEALKQRADLAESRAAAMESSLSWRITRPLRALAARLARPRGDER
jgi:hypothetical protein